MMQFVRSWGHRMVFVVWTCTIRVVSTRDFSPSCQDVELHVSAVYVRAWYNVYFEPGSDTCSFLPFFYFAQPSCVRCATPFFPFFSTCGCHTEDIRKHHVTRTSHRTRPTCLAIGNLNMSKVQGYRILDFALYKQVP